MKKYISIVFGILISLTLSYNYTIILPPVDSGNIMSRITSVIMKLRANLDGYSLIWCFVAAAFSIIVYKTISHELYSFRPLAWFVSLLFGFLNYCGNSMFFSDTLFTSYGLYGIIQACVLSLGWALLFRIFLFWFVLAAERNPLKRQVEDGNFGYQKSDIVQISLLAVVLFAVGWGIWIYSYYPASFDYDCLRQLRSYYSLNGLKPENHHPWFSTCILVFFHSIGNSLNDPGLGVFFYILIRDVCLVLLYIRLAIISLRYGFKKVVSFGIIVYFALTPVWGAYAKHAFKDTASAGLFAWCILCIVIIIKTIRRGESPKITNYIECFISALLACLFRGNVIYAVLPMLIMMTIICIKKTGRILAPLLLILPIICYFGYNEYIFSTGVLPGDVREMLSLPLQQTARTVRDHPQDISEQEETDILSYLQASSLDELAAAYDPILSDPVKNITADAVDFSNPLLRKYLKTWLAMGIRHPETYYKAGLGLSYGYYAFVPNQPEEGAGNWNSGMTLLDGMYLEGSGYIEDRQCFRDSMMGWADIWDRIPLVNLTDMCAIYFWLIISMMLYWIRHRRWIELIPALSLILLADTCMISPVNDCFRYFSLVAAAFPALILVD